MYDNGINNEFESAHQKGLTRGFDLGWSYKGRFDRQIIQDIIDELEEKLPKDTYAIDVLNRVLKTLTEHTSNREFTT